MSESINIEVTKIQENVTELMNQIITDAIALSTHLKRAELGVRNQGKELIQDIIVVAHCTMYMSHMSASDLEGIVESTLEYFKTGLYDTEKITGTARTNVPTHTGHVDKTSFEIRAWVYTADTHNDAGEWFLIYAFEKSDDAHKCITMLKEIESELKKLY